MSTRNRLGFLLFTVFLFASCKEEKKPSMSGDEQVQVSDFIDFFQTLKPPVQFGDTLLLKKEKDSLLISHKVFTQFIPDSVFRPVFAKGVKPKIYSLGKVVSKDGETYLFLKALSNDKKAMYVVVVDKKNKYLTAMTALRMDQSNITRQSLSVDRSMGITKTIVRKNVDRTESEGKDVYVFEPDSRKFILVMTDALDEKPAELLNPIDTLSRKQKYTADYGTGKKNLVSIRDGRKNDRLSFYIHIEKNNGECVGELKGEAIIKTANTAEYRMDGDPCILKFRFSSGTVTLAEESCGARRGLNCLFDGTYSRMKDPKPAKPVKKK